MRSWHGECSRAFTEWRGRSTVWITTYGWAAASTDGSIAEAAQLIASRGE